MTFLTLSHIRTCLSLVFLGFILSGCCSTPVKKTPAKQLCSGTKRPYEIKGIRYTPQDHYDYEESGVASWYGPGFDKKPGSCGTKFDMHSYTAAHKTLPIPSVVEVTNVDNGKTLHLVINDRGPFKPGRIIDLSHKAAMELGTHGKGLGNVRVKALPEQSVALANYLKQYGRYGLDPSGRGWDEIYRDEIADKHQQYLDQQEPVQQQLANAVYHPETDYDVQETLAVLSAPTLPPEPPHASALVHVQKVNTDFDALIHQVAAEKPTLRKKAAPAPRQKPMPPAAAPQGAHYIQVGNYVQKQNALKTQVELKRLGKASVNLTQPVRGQKFYTVKMGPFPSKQQAQKVMKIVANNGYQGVTLTN